jgi:hypothetical protein
MVSVVEVIFYLKHQKEGWMSITKERLNLAGWVAITNGIFTIPAVVISFYLGSDQGMGTTLAQAILIVASLGLFVYIISSLKLLLNSRFQFHDVDIYISYLIWGNLSLSIFHLLSLVNKEFEWAVTILSILAYIFFGILSIMFATRLLKLAGNLYGLLKPFSHLSLLSGICFISIMLLPVGILVGAVSDVILGVIFFRAAEQPALPDELSQAPIE